MSIRIIESIEHWNQACKYLKENNYKVWQSQYSWKQKEGFHAWFGSREDKEQIEIVTHNRDVEKEIVMFNSQK
jgi:hypothetical protein